MVNLSLLLRDTMSSAESTQQPPYPVRAVVPNPSSTDVGTSAPNGETCNSASTGQQQSQEGSAISWINHRRAQESLPLSLDIHNLHAIRAANEPIPEEPEETSQAAQPGPSATSKWKTLSSSPSSSRRVPLTDPISAVEDVDELVSDPPSRPRRSQGEEGGPSVSTPSEGEKSQREPDPNLEIPPASTPNAEILATSSHSKQITPSKQLPLSAFTPSLSVNRHGQSPFKPISPTKSPLRPTSKVTPSSRRSTRPLRIDQDSFGEPPTARTRLTDMLDHAHREYPQRGPGTMTRVEVEADNLLNLAGEPDPLLMSREQQPSYRSHSPPAQPPALAAEEHVMLLNEGLSGLPHVNSSPSVQPVANSTTHRPVVTYNHYTDIPSSSAAEEIDSQLFSQSDPRDHDFGSQVSHKTFHLAATQVAAMPQYASPQALFNTSPQALLDMPRAPIPSQITSPASNPLPVGVGHTPSQVSNTTSIPSVASHRRLVRSNPRVEEPAAVQPLIGPGRSIPITAQRHPARQNGHPLTDPGLGVGRPGDLEPTQIDDFLSEPHLGDGGLQATFIDAAPTSPPHDVPLVQPEAASYPGASSLPPSSPAKLVTSHPRPQPEGGLQPTYIDPRTLPTLPPAPRISPKQYVGRRRGKKTVMPEKDQSLPPPSDVEDETTGNDAGASGAPSEAPAPASPNGQVDGHQVAEDLAPRRRGKRKLSQSSDFTSGGGGPDSSPAPEDPEDYTYRPVPKTNGTASKPTRSKATKLRATRASSASTTGRESARKKVKVGEPNATPSRSGFRSKREHPVTPSSPLTELPSTPRRLRVWGWWAPSKAWFPGTVTSQHDDKFHVAFDDGTSRKLTIDRLRRLELRTGDQIKAEASVGKGLLDVAEDWNDENTTVVQVKEDGQSIGPVAVVEVCVPDKVVKERFEDRRVVPSDLGLVADNKPMTSRERSPVKAGDIFAGKVFLLTTSGTATMKDQEALARKIRKHGGKVEDDWTKLFDIPSHGFGSTLSSKVAPFLVTIGGEGFKAKSLASLVTGIPCLASAFIDAAIDKVSCGAGVPLS